MGKIYYIGNFSFPYGNASGARVIGNGYLLRDLGYEVNYIGLSDDVTEAQDLESTRSYYDKFCHFNFAYPKGAVQRLRYKKVCRSLLYHLEADMPDIVILYGSLRLSIINEKIRKWCVRKRVLFLIDCVDMIPSKSGSLLFRAFKALDEYYQKRVVNFRADGLIAISEYIFDFYERKIANIVIIPPLVSDERFLNVSTKQFDETKLNLIYVGIPFPTDGRAVSSSSFKDRLDLVIEILAEINDLKSMFRVYGLTKEQYLSVVPRHKELLQGMSDRIIFYGCTVSNEHAINVIKASDFSILLRDQNVMTKAGFPTKVVEAIACGIPVFTNNSSDIEEYLTNGMHGYLLLSLEKEYLKSSFRKLLTLDRDAVDKQKKYTQKNNPFLYMNYTMKMKKFLSELRS